MSNAQTCRCCGQVDEDKCHICGVKDWEVTVIKTVQRQTEPFVIIERHEDHVCRVCGSSMLRVKLALDIETI